MNAPGRFLLAAAVAAALVVPQRSAHAQGTQSPPSDAPRPDAEKEGKLAEAKRLFKQGNELRRVGDCQKALELYLASRALIPSVPNTVNSAYCLDQLGRFDEALEMYESLIGQFGSEMTETDKQSAASAMAALRRKVASVEISANIDGSLVVDGRLRGHVPLPSPLRVLSGTHTLRIIKDGWETYDTVFEVKPGEIKRIDAKLKPLTGSGRLRVEGRELEGADVLIDGVRVGAVPWEGTLGPGMHVYQARKGDRGSRLGTATVIQGQTVLVRVDAKRLGPELRIEIEPPTASLSIDRTAVGRGRWQGVLPAEPHLIEAREEGYFPSSVRIDERSSPVIKLALRVDSSHPRWGKPERGSIWSEGFGGVGVGSGLGSGAEAACPSNCADDALLFDYAAGARVGYELPFRLSIELSAGFMFMKTSVDRTFHESFPYSSTGPGQMVDVTYALHDDLRMSGPFAAAGASYRLPLGGWLELGAGAEVGVLFAGTRDSIDGTATGGGVTREIAVDGSGRRVRSAPVFVYPDLRATARIGAFGVGVGLGALVFVIAGPKNDNGELIVVATCNDTPTVDCTPNSGALIAERAHGRPLVWLPTLRAGYRF
jgi:hypothetical protein